MIMGQTLTEWAVAQLQHRGCPYIAAQKAVQKHLIETNWFESLIGRWDDGVGTFDADLLGAVRKVLLQKTNFDV